MFTTLNVAITGMRSAQMGLAVTGHNMANAEIGGFSRQRSIQIDHRSRTIGVNFAGQPLRVGTGVDNQAIHHIRSQYFDIRYRQHNARLHFYATLTSIGHHIETVIGETEGSYRMQNLLADMWASMHELNISLGSPETRDIFISTSIAFLEKAHNVFDELFEFQMNLDAQIRDMVTEINDLVQGIHRLNEIIHANELTGDNANDLRDERHRLMDRLSGLVPVEFLTDPRTGRIDIMTINGNFFLTQGSVNPLGLKLISGRYNFVEPVFTHTQYILDPSTSPDRYLPFFNWNRPINAANGNDEGALMALLHARGAMPATYRGIEALWNPIALPDGGFPGDLQDILEAMIGRPEPVPGNYITTPDFPTGADNPEFLMSRLEWQNARNQIEMLYPEIITDEDAFVAAVNAGPPTPLFVEMHHNYRAARRTYNQANWSKNHALIPRVQMYMDRIVNSVVTLINDNLAPVLNHTFDPDAPFDLNGNRSFTEVFVRRHMPIREDGNGSRFDDDGLHNPGLAGFFESLYTTRNLMINPLLLLPGEEGGYNLLALSLSGAREDTTVIQRMLEQWNDDEGPFTVRIGDQYFSIDRAYHVFITGLAVEIQESNTFLTTEFQQLAYADQRRNAISGVSLDEEISSMMTFQFAYQAAARLFNIVDSMIDTLINRTGRVGL